jgi:hypothetical protein
VLASDRQVKTATHRQSGFGARTRFESDISLNIVKIDSMTGRARHRGLLTRWRVVALEIATVAALTSISVPAGATTESRAAGLQFLQADTSVRKSPWTRLAYGAELAALEGSRRRSDDLTRTEHRAFRGIGAIVCAVDGKRRSSTAFLVGTFDIAVTVAHTFMHEGVWARSSDCIYHSADRWGQIRERIPIAYFRAQWRDDPSSLGEAAKDLAMVRLSRASRFAYRTLSFSRFSGSGAPVMLIGFRSDPDFEPLKHKRSGMLFEGNVRRQRTPDLPSMMHDVDARGLAPGAPVLDRRDGVVIGIHTRVPTAVSSLQDARSQRARRNAMLVMTEWLEHMLRAEISHFPNADAEQATVR